MTSVDFSRLGGSYFPTYTGWGNQLWTNIFFMFIRGGMYPGRLKYIIYIKFSCISLHVLFKLMVAVKSTGWCVLGGWLTIFSIQLHCF